MSVFITREFARFARREGIQAAKLREAAERAARGLIDADLGGGLIKQRVARPGQGRSGGFRTLMVFHAGTRTVFLYGFAKSERDNIGLDELDFWRRVAAALATMPPGQLQAMLAAGEMMELDDDGNSLSHAKAAGVAQDRRRAASGGCAGQGDHAGP